MSATIENDDLIHKSHLFEVHRLRLVHPDGHRFERDMIRHNGAAIVLPAPVDGSIVMIRNYRYPIGRYLWELPCGTLEDGEDPQTCAARELTEETGYTAGRLERLGAFYSCPGYNNEMIHAFLATDLTPGRQQLDGSEDIVVEVLPDAQVRRMAAAGEIEDGKTLATLGLFWLRQTGN
jgi:ADP-ribose pyrophosphatase